MPNLKCQISSQAAAAGGDSAFVDSFNSIASFFDSHTSYQRIASYVGQNGTTFPTQVGIWAFGVWRMVSASCIIDVFLGTVTASATYAATNGKFLVSKGGNGIGIMVAYHTSSAAWNGTTNNNGADSFTHPWKTGSVILPSNNSLQRVSGSIAFYDAPDKNRCLPLFGDANYYFYPQSKLIADENNFYISQEGTTGLVTKYMVFQKYEPSQDDYDLPYCMFSSNVVNSLIVPPPIFDNTPLGRYAAGGGCMIKKPSGTYLSASYDVVAFTPRHAIFLSALGSGSDFRFKGPDRKVLEWPYLVYKDGGSRQYLGYTTFMRCCPGYPAGAIFGASGSQRIIHGDSGINYPSASFPWIDTAGLGPVYSSGSYFKTGSYFGASHLSTSNLFPSISVTSSQRVLYRYYSAGSNFYTNNPTGAESNLTVIVDDDQSTQ